MVGTLSILGVDRQVTLLLVIQSPDDTVVRGTLS